MAFIRAREIEEQLRNRGFERGVLYVLQVLAEQQIALQNSQRDQADMLNKMTDIQIGLVTVGEQMKNHLQQVDRMMNEEDGLDRNTYALEQRKKN